MIHTITIKILSASDIADIVDAFGKVGWLKPASLFDGYFQEQLSGKRMMWVARMNDQIAGYVTLKWESLYSSFATAHIPEIMDLNVLPAFRNGGIGSQLLDWAEGEAATRCDAVGLGVGLYGGDDGGYGAAQKLYVKRGYIPDGKGVTYNYQYAQPGSNVALDDDLVLWFIKRLQ